MKSISSGGLVLFLTGFALFLLLLTLGQFRLTEAILMDTIKPEYRAIVLERTISMRDKLYSNQWAFINDFKQAVNSYNDEIKAKQQWDEVIYNDYVFPVTRAASVGTIANQPGLWFLLSIGLATLGGLLYILPNPKYRGPAGIRNNYGATVQVAVSHHYQWWTMYFVRQLLGTM